MLGTQPNNVVMAVKKGILTLTVDLTKKGTPSKSGKSNVIASTYGNVTIPEIGVTIGLNIYKKIEQTIA